MGTHCPVDLRACPDDLCRGSDSCMRSGFPLLERCGGCLQLTSAEIDFCECDPYEGDDFDEESE